jgi:hypothetical protein
VSAYEHLHGRYKALQERQAELIKRIDWLEQDGYRSHIP